MIMKGMFSAIVDTKYYVSPLDKDFTYFKPFVKYLEYLTGKSIKAEKFEDLPPTLHTKNFRDPDLSNQKIIICNYENL